MASASSSVSQVFAVPHIGIPSQSAGIVDVSITLPGFQNTRDHTNVPELKGVSMSNGAVMFSIGQPVCDAGAMLYASQLMAL